MFNDSNTDVDDHDFRIVSPNGRYDHENGLLGDETDGKIEYTTYHTENDSETGAIAELSTSQLMTGKENRLVITHKPSGNVILDISLNKYLNALRLQQYSGLSLQECLDRADKHGITLFFKGMDNNGNCTSVDVQIDDWLTREQGVDEVQVGGCSHPGRMVTSKHRDGYTPYTRGRSHLFYAYLRRTSL